MIIILSVYITLYKIIAKILVQRLKTTFIANHHILDNLMLAQEIMYSLHCAPPSRDLMLLKIDMKKVYDQVHWSYLFNILI